MIKFFIIAGEASGDLLGSKIITELQERAKKSKQKFEFVGVGGDLMKSQGLKSIFAMEELSVMGFSEVVPHIPRLLKRINQTVQFIKKEKPHHIITIDSPDFCFRVVKKLKSEYSKSSELFQKFSNIKKTHLIAPSVWAYREKRAQKIARLYDLLLAILPFEPPYFEKYSLKTVFIGNPVVEKSPDFAKKEVLNKKFRQKYKIKTDDILIYITPGSRNGEVKRIFPEFIKAISLLSKTYPNIKIAIPLVAKTSDLVRRMSQKLVVNYQLIDSKEKESALFAANFALAKSGTNTIEISLYQIPMIIAYKVSFFTYILAKILLKVKFANLINLILNKEVIPEMIQKNCRGTKICNELLKLVGSSKASQQQIDDSKISLNILGLNSKISSTKKCVNAILDYEK